MGAGRFADDADENVRQNQKHLDLAQGPDHQVRVPADHLWGAQTQRSIENFPIGVDRHRWGRPVIRAFGILKKSGYRGYLSMEYDDVGDPYGGTEELLEKTQRFLA